MDVQRLRELAGLAQEMADDTRGVAAAVAGARGVVWQSVRAEHYRAELAVEAGAVRRAADALEQAAAALRVHAREVQQRLDQLADLQHWFAGAVQDARRALADAAGEARQLAAGAVPEGQRGATGPGSGALADAQRLVAAAGRAPVAGSPDWPAFVAGLR